VAGQGRAHGDNYFAALNCAVFSDGTFVYVPEGVRCPMELSTYFRINAENTGQFERTLIVCDKGAYVSYLEGCTAPSATRTSFTPPWWNWSRWTMPRSNIPPSRTGIPAMRGQGRHLQFRHQARAVPGQAQQGELDPGGNRQRHHLEIPVLRAERRRQRGRVLLGRRHQQPSAGRHRHQDDPQWQGQPLDHCQQGHQRGQVAEHLSRLVRVAANAEGVRNFTQCDSLLLGKDCGAHTVPYIEVRNPSATIEHEATTSKISDDQLFYAMQRGLDQEASVALIVNGFAKEVLQQLPMEFAVEAQKLLGISLEGSVG
jgi:Fe-S cluster assembly protein SufB